MENQWDEEQNQAKFNIIPAMNRDICNKMEYGFPKSPKSFQKENKTAILENRNLAKNRNSATTRDFWKTIGPVVCFITIIK